MTMRKQVVHTPKKLRPVSTESNRSAFGTTGCTQNTSASNCSTAARWLPYGSPTMDEGSTSEQSPHEGGATSASNSCESARN